MTVEIKPGDNNENYGLALREAQSYINELQQENRKLKEVWEKVINDIEDIDGNYSPAYWDGVNDVADIIDKHLREVENG